MITSIWSLKSNISEVAILRLHPPYVNSTLQRITLTWTAFKLPDVGICYQNDFGGDGKLNILAT